MEAIIKGLVGVLVYINNLLIHSNTNEIKSLATTRPGLLSLTDIIQTTTKPTNPGAILEFCLQHYWSYHITSSIDQHLSLLIIILHTQNFLKPYPSLSAYTLITIIPTWLKSEHLLMVPSEKTFANWQLNLLIDLINFGILKTSVIYTYINIPTYLCLSNNKNQPMSAYHHLLTNINIPNYLYLCLDWTSPFEPFRSGKRSWDLPGPFMWPST